jgi:hypothetical protein
MTKSQHGNYSDSPIEGLRLLARLIAHSILEKRQEAGNSQIQSPYSKKHSTENKQSPRTIGEANEELP